MPNSTGHTKNLPSQSILKKKEHYLLLYVRINPSTVSKIFGLSVSIYKSLIKVGSHISATTFEHWEDK